jgi:hypothetical protein
MPRYLVLKFEYDDEFGLFPDDFEIMLFRHSKPPFHVEIVGEAKFQIGYIEPSPDPILIKVVPIGQTDTQAT